VLCASTWESPEGGGSPAGDPGRKAASIIQIYIVAPYTFSKTFATLQGDARGKIYANSGTPNMTRSAAVKLHQFLSGQQEADKLLANLIAFTRQPAMGVVCAWGWMKDGERAGH
jgi:hypothetical protein